MADHIREEDQPGDDLDYEAKYDAYMEWLDEQVAKQEKPRYSKVIVGLCLVTVIAYTVACFFYLWNGKPLNDTLTVLFFGCFGLEFASLAFIRGRELRYVDGNPANKQMPHIETKEDEGNEQVPKQKVSD